MALLSDLDWVILLGVGAFLLLGSDHREIFQTIGRWYGRAIRLKRDLLSQVADAASLPLPPPGQPVSIRAVLLGNLEERNRDSVMPAAVPFAPGVTFPPVVATAGPHGLGASVWATVPAPGASEPAKSP